MLKNLNPPYAEVGMVAFPPVQTHIHERMCRAVQLAQRKSRRSLAMNGYDAATRGYLTDRINGTFKLSNGRWIPPMGCTCTP